MGVKKGQLDVSKAITGSDKLSDTLGQVSDKLETLTSALKDVQEKSSKKINFQADMSDLEKAEAVLQRFKISIDDLKKEEALPILKKLKDMQDDKSIKGVSVKNAQGVFTTVDDAQKQMIDAWNTLMESRPGGVSQLSDLVSSGDKNATAVLRWANAFEALGGDIAEVNPIINDFIQKMRSLDVFSSDKGYTYGVENLKKIFEQFKELQKLGASFKKFNDTVTQMPEIKPLKIFGSDNTEEYEEETDRIEKSTERQKKALLSLEEIKQRLAAKRREKTNFYSDNDLNSIFGFDDDFEDSDNLIQTYSKVLKRLQDERDKELDDIEYWQNAHARAHNEGDDSRASQYFGYMEESIKQYYQYADAIEYVQGRLQEATLNFKPGESWGANEIQATITLLQELAKHIDIIKQKFETIDSIEGFQSLIEDIGSISKDINNLGQLFHDVFAAFDESGKIISMTSQLQSLVETVRQLGDSLKDAKFNINIGSGESIGQIAARQSLTSIEAIQKYKRAYEELLDLLSSDGNSLSIFKGNDKLFKQFFEANELIGGESKTSQLQGYKIAIEALKQASSIKGIDLSQWIDEFEKVAIAADQAYEKVIMGNSTEDIAQKLFGGGGNISVEDFKTMSDQIKELKNTVLSISQILSDVFSPILDTIKDKFQEESTKFTSVGEAVGFITQKIEEKNSKIREEAEAVESASGVEVEYFQAIEFAVEAIVQQLNNLLAVLPSIKFDEFIGSESASKLGEFVSNLTELSRILDTIDDKDVFHHLNDILQAPGENFSNNLQKIKNGFNDLKTVMNGFNDNGSAVFKSLSDIATAGDAVIEKMQKLFEQSGVKLPLAEQEIVGTPVNVNGSNSASRERVKIKIQENNGAQKRLEDNLQAIRDLGKANTMKNLVEAKGAAGKASVDELVDSLQKVREAAEKAEIAIGDLYQMKKEGLISQEDLDRYLELYESDEIVNGTLQSQSKAQLAIETQREKQVRESDKAIKQLSDSYIELAQAEEKAANASTEADRELGRRQVDAIKIKQKELREQVGKLIGSERLKTVETFAQADADEYKRLLSEKRSGKISTSINDLGFSDTDNVEKTWDTLISKASRYQAILYKEKSGKTLTATEAEFLQKLKPLYDEAGNHAEQAGEKYNQLNDALKKSQDNIKESILGQYEQSIGGLTDNDIKKPDAYNEQVKKLKTNLEELKKVQFGSDDWFNRINLLDEGLKKLNSDASMKSVKQSSIETLDRKMAEWINSNSAAGEFRVQVEQLRDSLSNVRSKEEFNGIVSDFERVKAAAADAGKTGQSFGEGLIKRFKSLGQYLLSFASFYRIIGTIKQAVSIVTELNDALTEMRKVSSESLSTLEKFQFKTFDLADQVGTNAVAVQKSTAAWLRLGKDFNEAQQAAVDSTKLLNTTEIENIDDATSSLLSITQAYREITREDAIDKINNIGDHFSSSSSDLAQGLKNVSAVLKTQGNDIDQALALLTAGNDITQDISKASMGVRTIALRISGTEEAKNEIQDMGEDIDDFVVRTKSKTDKIIRDYTAVASNAYKGVSVLDENGNLRSTYDILLDISRVYKEIQEEDKKRGTNRAAALVEELAGKTRSQIASSILLNPELLEEAYVAAQNSEGVGQMELDRYLDSISAKVQQLQNRIQELAFTAVDSDFVKTIVDGLTAAVKLATQLTDTLGTLPTLAGTLGAVFAQSAGFGLFANKKGKGGLVNYFKNFASNIQLPKTVTTDFVRPFSLALDDALSGMADDADPTILFYDMFGSPQSGFNDWVNGLGDSDEVKNALLNMQAGTTTVAELKQELIGLNTIATQTRAPISGLGAAFSGVVSVGKQLISTMGTMLIFTAVSFAAQELVKWIYSLATAQERAIEAGKEASNQIKNTANSYNDTKKSISELKDEYAKLSEGVRSTDVSVENVYLSDDEFKRYLDISKQIAELSPELITGYDSQGNAIVNLGNSVESVNSKFEEYLKLQRDIANTDISSNLDAVFEGALNSEKKYSSKIEEAQQRRDRKNKQANSKRLENGSGELVDFIQANDGLYDIVIPGDESDKWTKKLKELGAGWDKFDNGDNTITIQVDTDDLDDVQVRNLNAMYSATSTSTQKEAIFSEAEIKKYELLIANAYKEIIPSVKDYIETTPLFDDIGATDVFAEKLRTGMINMFSQMDYQSLSDDIKEKGGLEYFVDDIISSMIATEDTQRAFAGLSDLASRQGDMTYSEIVSARDRYFEIIMKAFSDGEGGSLFTADQLNLLFGYSSKDEADVVSSIFEKRVSTASEKLGMKDDDLLRLLDGTSYANAQDAVKAVEQMSQDSAEDIAGNYDKIYKFLKPYLTGEKINAKPIYDDTLKALFENEEYSKSASEYESHLSSITGAMETLRTEGELTAEQMADLQETLSDYSFDSEEDFSYENLASIGANELGEWIGTIRKAMETMDPINQSAAQTYIDNLIKSMSDLKVSAEDARQAVYDSLVTTPLDYSDTYATTQRHEQEKQFNSVMSDLQSHYGEELDWNIVWQLAVNDQLSGEMNDIYAKYDELKVTWDLEVGDVETQSIIESLTSDRELRNAEKSYAESLGKIVGEEFYDNDIQISKGLIEQYQRDLKNLDERYYNTERNEYVDRAYKAKRNEILQNIYAENSNIADDERQKTLLPMVGREQALQAIQSEADALQRSIDAAESRGQEVSAEQYQSMINNAERQKFIAGTLQQLYSDAAEEAKNAGNMTDYLDWTEKANTYADSVANLDQQIIQWADDIQNIDLTHLQNEMTDFQNKSDDLINSLEDASDLEKVSIYYELQTNAQDERANLQSQRKEIINQFLKDNAALRKETGEGFTPDSERYRQYKEDLRGVDEQLKQLTKDQREWADALMRTPVDIISKALEKEQSKLEKLQSEIELREARGERKTIDDYNAESALYQDEARGNRFASFLSGVRANMYREFSKKDSAYIGLADEAEAESESYFNAFLDALTNKANTDRESKDLHFDLMQNEITELEQAASRYQDVMSEIEATGNRVTAEQYQNLMNNADAQIDIYDSMIADRIKDLNKAEREGRDADALTYRQEIAEWQSSRSGLRQNKTDWYLKQQETVLNDALNGYEKLQLEQQEVQNQIDAAEAAGLHGTQAQYSRLAENAKSQIENLEQQRTLWQSIADQRAVKFGVDSTYYTDALKQVQDLSAQQNELQAQYIQNLTQPYIDQIDDLSERYSDLQNEQSAIQDNLELREKKGYKTTARDYKRLLKNAQDQKKNIEEQNSLLRKQRKAIQDAGGDWSDVQDQIESNNESIRGLNSSIFDYEQSIKTSALTEAQALSSAIQQAMSEMASETGLSTDTILQLKQAFSDLKSMDISTLFYRTADGVKMSVNTLNTLIEAENTLKNNELDEQIRAQQEAMEKEAAANGTLTSAYRKMEDELLNLMNTRSQYFATYQEQLAAIDGHSLIELAKSTANPLDRYDQSREYLKEAYEMYEKGQIGSDDFKAIASYFDINGFSDEATFKENYDRYSQYFTEDATGLVKFWDKLVASGVAAKDELGNYILTMGDVEKAAEAANVPLAVFQDIIMATNDYGADVAFVTSVQDGREQLAGLNKELRDEQVKLEQLKASGAEQSVIDKQAEVVKNVENSITNLQSATDAAVYSERRSFLEGAKGAKQLWEAYSGYRDDAMEDGDIEGRRFWEQMMRSLAEEYDLEIKPGFEFDQEGYNQLMSEVESELNSTEYLKLQFGVSDEDVTSAKEAFDNTFHHNRAEIEKATESLRNYSAAELLAINHADGDWSEGEKEIEEFAASLGIPLEQINALIIALQELGILKPEVEVEAETEDAKTDIESLTYEEAGKPIEKEVEIKGPSPEKLAEVEENVKRNMNFQPDDSKSLKQGQNTDWQLHYTINTTMADGAITPKEVQAMSNEQIELHFGVSGADEVQKVRDYVAEIDAANGYDLTVHIDETQMSSLLEAINPENPIEVEVDDNPWKEFVEEVENKDLTVKIKTQVDTSTPTTPLPQNQHTGASSVQSRAQNQGAKVAANVDSKAAESSVDTINQMLGSLDVGKTYITIDGQMAINQINEFNNLISNLDVGRTYITIDGQAAINQINEFNNLITTGLEHGETNINVDTTLAKQVIEDFNNSIDNVHDGKSIISVNTSQAIKKINSFNATIGSIPNGSASVSVSGVTLATSQVNNLIRQLNELNGKRSTYTVTRVNQVSNGGDGGLRTPSALGTAHALGGAFAFGNAYASGQNWGVPDNEDALVNEVGQESIVRDGHWFLLPGGPHVEKLKKNDIVFNAEQTEDLIETGKTARRGKIVGGAYANGTANGMSAFAGVSGGWKLPTNVKQSTSASNQNYAPTSTNTGKGKSKNKKSGLDALKEWLEKLFDWVEVRVERLEYTIDLYQAKAENNIGYIAKNKLIQDAFNTTNTLITDAQRGADKYLEQAELVRKKAVQLGVVSNDASKNLVKLIQSGEIQISEYDEKTREFINDYKEWFDKSLDLTAKVEDLKTQLKELEQTKLDNITEQFESLASWSDAVSARAQAMGEFLTSAGKTVNSADIKSTFGTQIFETSLMIGRYQDELKAFANELVVAKSVFGENSNEYHEAMAQYEEINRSLIEASTQYNELNKQLYELDLTKLEYAMDKLEQFGDKLASIVSLKETRGTLFGATSADIIGESDYSQQIRANNDIIKIMAEDRQKRINEIAQFGWDVDSENYKEAYDAIMNDEKEILNLLESNEKLKESIRTLRWKPFEELQKQIEEATGDYDHLRDLITDNQKFDSEDGIYMTARGYADLALLAQQIGITQGKIADYRKALDKLQSEYKNGNISLETLNESSRDYINTIQSSVTAVDGYKDAIIELYKTQITNENSALQDTIDLRKKALSAKKAYYDFDKTLKEKNKDIANLRAQINALSGVTNQAAQAQRAKLQAQLAEAEEELKDTIRQHQYEATSQGYDQLSEDSQEALDNTIKQLEANADQQDQIVNMMLDRLKTHYSDAYTSIQDIISSTGTVIGDVANSSINQLETTADKIISLAKAMEVFQTQASATANNINTSTITTADSAVKAVENTIKANNTDATIANAKASTQISGKAATPNVVSATTAVDNAAANQAKSSSNTGNSTSTTPTTPTTPTTQTNTRNQAEYDAIMAAINLGKKRSSVSAAEQKKHLPIWNYITTKYKHELQYKVYSALAKAMNKFWGTKFTTDGKKLSNANKAKMLELLKAHGYKAGSKRIPIDEMAWTNENWKKDGSELIISKRDGAILTPLKAGDSVIPADLADNLFKWGAINPSMLQDKFVSKLPNFSSMSTNMQTPVTIESIITVNGNVDESVMPQLEELGKQLANNLNFQRDMTKVISHNLYKDAKKQGYRK